MFTGASTKFSIGSLDIPELEVDAQFNPKELQFDQSYNWKDATNTAGQSSGPQQEFSGANAESVKVDLLFDGYEGAGKLNAYAGEDTVQDQIRTLREMATVVAPNDKDRNKRRPHVCVATWGTGKDAMPRFECVIESISVKYQVFANNGDILRALVTISLKGASRKGEQKEVDSREARQSARAKALAASNARRADAEASSWQERGLNWRGQNRFAEHPEQTEVYTESDTSFADREYTADERQKKAAKAAGPRVEKPRY